MIPFYDTRFPLKIQRDVYRCILKINNIIVTIEKNQKMFDGIKFKLDN